MQVKKFEAPTLQEALDTIKRELGPEAIILQTKQNRRGFGLMSKGSVEVTAAVSERAAEKKATVEKRIPDGYKQKLSQVSASKQADQYESYLEKRVEREKVQISGDQPIPAKRITATRYADIEDETTPSISNPARNPAAEYTAPAAVGAAIDQFSGARGNSIAELEEEVIKLKKIVEDLRKDHKRPEYLESDSPYSATDALESAYDLLVQSGMERRHAIEVMRETARTLGVEKRADHEMVLDQVAEALMKGISIESFFDGTRRDGSLPSVHAFVGSSGAGKTALVAKLGTHAIRSRHEKVGIIRVSLGEEESVDPLVILAKALHVPYRVVTTGEELQVALQDMSQCERLFVDTPGISVRDSGSLRKLDSILQSHPGIQIGLVMNATTRDQELREQARVFQALAPRGILITRLDEAYSLGSAYSLARHLSLPVTIFSNGRKVTENWENASAERITASILNIL